MREVGTRFQAEDMIANKAFTKAYDRWMSRVEYEWLQLVPVASRLACGWMELLRSIWRRAGENKMKKLRKPSSCQVKWTMEVVVVQGG